MSFLVSARSLLALTLEEPSGQSSGPWHLFPGRLRTESQSSWEVCSELRQHEKALGSVLLQDVNKFSASLKTAGLTPPASFSRMLLFFQHELSSFLFHHQWSIQDENFNACTNTDIASSSTIWLGTCLLWR